MHHTDGGRRDGDIPTESNEIALTPDSNYV